MDDYEYMIKEERKNRILELAESHEIISIDDIAQALEVSKATVRRDIDELDAEGSVEKTRGGIMSVNHKLRIEPSLRMRSSMNVEEKARMAEAARTMGLSEDAIERFATVEDAVRVIGPVLAPGDLVLVKASRASGLDRFVRGVLAQ